MHRCHHCGSFRTRDARGRFVKPHATEHGSTGAHVADGPGKPEHVFAACIAGAAVLCILALVASAILPQPHAQATLTGHLPTIVNPNDNSH